MRTHYQVAKEIRKALHTDIFPPGTYTPAQIFERLVEKNIISAMELHGVNALFDQIKQVPGWTHNGKAAGASRWFHVQPLPVAELQMPQSDDAELLPVGYHLHLVRDCHAMLKALCKVWNCEVPDES